ncbi:MAG TPA: hypothetical protein DD377_01170 [Firmicutes bacterium]|nr:hypothetical protein [Bacillota bacterium]
MMKKILFVAPLDTKDRFKGGITSFAEAIIKNKSFFNENFIDFVPFNNCIINRRPGTNGKFSLLNFLNYFETKKKLKKELKNNKYDAIYINSSYGISLLKDLMTIKRTYAKEYHIFLHIHFADLTSIFTKKKIVRSLIKKQLKTKITTIISLSTILKNDLIKEGYKKETIVVLYNFFDPTLPRIDESFIRSKYCQKKERKTFLFVGSLDKRKGFYDLIKVFKRIDGTKAKLIICGKPNDSKSKDLLNAIKNNDIFEYRGYVEGKTKIQAFKDADFFILPSYAEGLPITILEAFRFGLPVISTHVGAIPEIINNNIGAIVFPGNLVELKNVIGQYINQDTLNISLNCLKESEKYTYNTFSKNLLNIIKSKL